MATPPGPTPMYQLSRRLERQRGSSSTATLNGFTDTFEQRSASTFKTAARPSMPASTTRAIPRANRPRKSSLLVGPYYLSDESDEELSFDVDGSSSEHNSGSSSGSFSDDDDELYWQSRRSPRRRVAVTVDSVEDILSSSSLTVTSDSSSVPPSPRRHTRSLASCSAGTDEVTLPAQPLSRRYVRAPRVIAAVGALHTYGIDWTDAAARRSFEDLCASHVERVLRDKVVRGQSIGERAGLGLIPGKEMALWASVGRVREAEERRRSERTLLSLCCCQSWLVADILVQAATPPRHLCSRSATTLSRVHRQRLRGQSDWHAHMLAGTGTDAPCHSGTVMLSLPRRWSAHLPHLRREWQSQSRH